MSDTQKLSKDELVALVAEKAGQTKKLTAEILDVLFDVVISQVASGVEVPIHRFGKFTLASRSVFEGLPGAKNREKGTRNVVRFKMSAPLKALLNG